MCGIFCCISRHGHRDSSSQMKSLLAQRGPDHLADHRLSTSNGVHIQIISSVLSMRGTEIVPQPLIHDETGSILCWNGEAWRIDDDEITQNDTRTVLDMLVEASQMSGGDSNIIMQAFSRIRGPFACIYYDIKNSKLYFGRDCLGRRSLVNAVCSNGDLLIASVADLTISDVWTEVEADGLYVLSLSDLLLAETDVFAVEHRPLFHAGEAAPPTGGLAAPYPSLCTTLPDAQPARVVLESEAVDILEHLIQQSLRLRIQPASRPRGQPFAVLFSGGLDCTLLAYYCHKLLPIDVTIDLLNVAFQNPRIHDESLLDPYATCPDRKTGLSSLGALQQQCPGRQFQFVAINVPYTESMSHRNEIVRLMHPHDTEMDLSIASALYFAARGQGSVYSEHATTDYTTTARVLISGLGADELFAGYSRHTMAYKRGGFSGLISELTLDFHRLGKRNLGRDDRVTSHWGREVRYPFLDEDLVKWAVECPVWQKCGFGCTATAQEQPDIEDGKLVLRLIAWKVGLSDAAREKKRAIQFGSRTAKMHARKTKGTDSISTTTPADHPVD